MTADRNSTLNGVNGLGKELPRARYRRVTQGTTGSDGSAVGVEAKRELVAKPEDGDEVVGEPEGLEESLARGVRKP
jgi:hypothetical protein